MGMDVLNQSMLTHGYLAPCPSLTMVSSQQVKIVNVFASSCAEPISQEQEAIYYGRIP